jgi:hypothetical protein
MNHVKSCPSMLCEMEQISCPTSMLNSISKSPSLESFLTIKQDEITTIQFEGDGPLGILLIKKNGLMEVCGIVENTVANEYYDLKIGMIVNKVNNFEYKDFNYENFIKLFAMTWNNYGEMTIEFIKPKNEIIDFLEEIDCLKHYTLFEELGAKTYEDLKYIESTDLSDIDIVDKSKIKSSIKKIHSEIFEFDSP